MFKKSDAQHLVDLNEHLRALLNSLFPSGIEVVYTDETWINDIDSENRHIADEVMTKIIDQYNLSTWDLLTRLRKQWISLFRPNLDPSGIENAIIDIGKVFIWEAEKNLDYGVQILNQAIDFDILSDEFEYVAERAAYSKKLAEYSRAFVESTNVKDNSWNRQYAARHLSYASFCVYHACKHLEHASDSQGVILQAVSTSEYAADVASNVAETHNMNVSDQITNVIDTAGHIAQLAIGIGGSPNSHV